MSVLSGKKIVLGITGSIAAYKSALLTRLLVKAGAEVKVVMTPAAIDFITPLTLSTLSKNPVMSDFTEDKDTGEWTNHVEVGLWADAIVIAPASANTMAKMAGGVCDNFLLAVYLSAKCPVFVAPAMDLDMFKHESTTSNLRTLSEHGVGIIDAGEGELASGLEGKGRMAEPEEIVGHLDNHFNGPRPLSGRKALVTAGPTYESIDPVRFIGNRSTGKMGYRIAEALANAGAEVALVSGPTHEKAANENIKVIAVESAQEMFEACQKHWSTSDIGVLAAAVADYRPSQVADKKIKKSDSGMTMEIERTTDILATLGEDKKGRFLVGFALETDNEEENARGKLKRKNLDMIVLNSLADKGAGFGHDTNKVSVILSNNKMHSFELKSKAAVAADIVKIIIQEIDNE